MKKLTLSVAVLLGSISTKAQTEYIDISTKNVFGRSEMVVYNDVKDFDDLEYFYLGPTNKNYHWVEYTNANNILVSLQDKPGKKREICTQDGEEKVQCKVVDAHATQYRFFPKNKVFQIYISKTLKDE